MPVTMEEVVAFLSSDEPDYDQAALLGDDASPHLARLIEGSDDMMAAKAASLAGYIEGDRALGVIEAAAKSETPTVRVAAAGAARQQGSLATADVVASLLRDEDRGVRKVALSSVRSDMGPEVTDRVQEMSSADPDAGLRERATNLAEQL